MARLLVVDDEEVVRDLLTSVLQGEGHEVQTAEDGAKGLASFRSAPFDVVITDILMPAMDGLELIRALRREGVPVRIIATAAVGDMALNDALQAGADATLPKPFKIDVLLETVDANLSREG